MNIRSISITLLALLAMKAYPSELTEADITSSEASITLIENTEDQRVYEFRQNGVLMMIKVIPSVGRPYYLVPANGEAHFTDLTQIKHLYPQWTLIEW
ncbi:MAG: DUF2782 domain-containing protein [Pseudomonadales bacterium]|nr:DUF2782 domain-containing protein [Pseudomonadales bacterium]MDA0956736.1 DUF2782 domain-containing protein [Pseudomonadota bacterium]MDA1207115.1 DUF2782 domain-containing protein [Pseudomonadota bacterium]